MTERWVPTDEELDALLDARPRFDLDAVKARTLSAVTGEEKPEHHRGRLFLRCTLIAAALCLLSVTALAAMDTATGGRITAALGIRTAVEPVPEPETVTVEEIAEPELVPGPEPVTELPEPAPEEPPELDRQMADSLGIREEQVQRLRPAVQRVEQTAEEQDVRMTVLQTLGDPACLYVKLRFDFPEEVPVSEDLEFEEIDLTLEGAGGAGLHGTVLERTGRSVTYLLCADRTGGRDGDGLNGQTATVSFRNYGRRLELEGRTLRLTLNAGERQTVLVDPSGNVTTGPEGAAAFSAGLDSIRTGEDGFTIAYGEDGTTAVTYDGAHGDQYLTVLYGDGDTVSVVTGDDPAFETVVSGKWEQSWRLAYEDLSLYWEGEENVFRPELTLTGLRLSPLSWEAEFTARELDGDALYWGLLPEGWTAQLLYRDGSLKELTANRKGGGQSDERDPREPSILVERMTASARFDQPVDISDVVAIVIDGAEFPLS